MSICTDYWPCGCATADDLHCMYCCRDMATHAEISEGAVRELQCRIMETPEEKAE